MDQPESNIGFRLMALWLRVRDLFSPPSAIVGEAGIREGDYVLDFGCGPGSYALAAAELVGTTGKVYALDIHPLALRNVVKAATRRKLSKVETICSDCATGLESESVDVVLLFDVLHCLSEAESVLKELHRVLKPKGILSVSDHHMKEEDILAVVTNDNLFRLLRQGKRTYNYSREQAQSGV